MGIAGMPEPASPSPSAAAPASTATELRSQLAARVAGQARLEAVHAELRGEFETLRHALEEERAHRRDVESRAVVMAAQLADGQAELDRLHAELDESILARDTAVHEANELRSELERLGSELAGELERTEAESLAEAEQLLAEARALTASLREDVSPRAGSVASEDPRPV
jgi:chromosome segregation ATPase